MSAVVTFLALVGVGSLLLAGWRRRPRWKSSALRQWWWDNRAARHNRVYSRPNRLPSLQRLRYRVGIRLVKREIGRYWFVTNRHYEQAVKEDPENARRVGILFGKIQALNHLQRCDDVDGIMSGNHPLLWEQADR